MGKCVRMKFPTDAAQDRRRCETALGSGPFRCLLRRLRLLGTASPVCPPEFHQAHVGCLTVVVADIGFGNEVSGTALRIMADCPIAGSHASYLTKLWHGLVLPREQRQIKM